jgi:PiT family inorganic phosphate transporter
MFHLLGGIFLGWSLGANDAANLFGSAVCCNMIRFWKAAFLASVFVILGAILQGGHGIETLKGLSPLDLELAVLTSVAAAVTVTSMTLLRLPVSTSQAVVGAIVGAGLLQHQLYLQGLVKVVMCWVGTPLAGIVFSLFVYPLLGRIYNRSPYNLFQMDQFTRIGLVIAGCYSAFALGSNNVANVTAVFVGAGRLDVFTATLIGGLSIALGILTFSRGVMRTVGRDLVPLDPYSALVVVLSGALAVHVYTWIGVPVSSSQAVVGAVVGIGILKGSQTIRKRTLLSILLAWFVTPLTGCLYFFLFYYLSHLQYVP